MSLPFSHGAAVLAVLLVVELGLMALAGSKRYSFLFKVLPAVFWIYFLPMVLSTAGVVDRTAVIYSQLSEQILPAALFLLLLAVDLRAIVRLGPWAIGMFLIGSGGIALGTLTAFAIFRPWVGGQFWSGFAALSGSWSGGSANMVAVKEAFGTPQEIFAPMVIVDTIVSYTWMAVLLSLARFQRRFDAWNRCDRTVVDHLRKAQSAPEDTTAQLPIRFLGRIPRWIQYLFILACLLAAAFAVTQISYAIAAWIPASKTFSKLAWVIILSSSAGLLFSLARIRALDGISQKWGYVLLYLVLAAIGAQADLSRIGSAYRLILAGFLMVSIQAGCLFVATRILRVPLGLAVTASQANIGGVASAPVVAESFFPGMASVGLLMAILGNIIGTYVGILTGTILQFINR
ncbi:MAG: DUF819 family protein [Phycisphaerae bacterium]|nr:DUF819 family protein [Phycisphaerae bacterium]